MSSFQNDDQRARSGWVLLVTILGVAAFVGSAYPVLMAQAQRELQERTQQISEQSRAVIDRNYELVKIQREVMLGNVIPAEDSETNVAAVDSPQPSSDHQNNDRL